MYMDFGHWGHDTGEDRIPGNTVVDCVATDGQKEGLPVATARSWRGYAADLTLRLAHKDLFCFGITHHKDLKISLVAVGGEGK